MDDSSPETVERFAQWQLERELKARERVARAAGLALIDLTAILEEENATLGPSVDPLGMVLVAFAARGRRLLRAAYRLLDQGDGAEAVPLLRTISEYLVVGRWLAKDPERLEAWALADLDRRDYVIGEVIRELGEFDEETLAALQRERDALAESRKLWLSDRGSPIATVVNVEQMAADAGLGLAYQLAYRTQSQSDVHATPLAVDACYERLPDGSIRILPAPRHALSDYDQYALGAHMFRDLIAMTNHHVRSFLWTTGLEGITAALEAMRDSDPRKHANAEQRLLEAAQERIETHDDEGGGSQDHMSRG